MNYYETNFMWVYTWDRLGVERNKNPSDEEASWSLKQWCI